MRKSGGTGVFGTNTRTQILLVLALMEESHASELARLLGNDVSTIQNAVATLEESNLVSGVYEGRSRRLRLNPRYFAYDELRALLDKLALANGDLIERISKIRRRPRRQGKPV